MKNGNKFLTPVVATCVLLFMLLGFFRPISAFTQDLGRHILTGEMILQTMSVPSINQYSYTYPDFPFINTHWLSEVAFAFVFNMTGITGLFVLMLGLVAAAVFLQLSAAYRQASFFGLGVVGLIYGRVLFERTDLRPELFSFLFLSFTVVLLYRYRDKATNLIFLLIPLQLLWVNAHIYFAIGLVVQGLFLIDLLSKNRKRLLTPEVKKSFIVFILSGMVSLLNPNGVQGLFYPLTVFNNYGYTIEENQTVFLLESLGFQKPSILYLKVAIFLLFASLSLSFRKTRLIDWMLSIVFTILAFSAVRNFPLFVFATFIPSVIFFSETLRKLSHYASIPSLKPYYILIGGILFVLFLGFQVQSIQKIAPLGFGVTQGAEKAVDFLVREKVHGPIFNNFDIGGYLIYRLYPSERVFVDGRPEAYPASFFTDIYMPMQQNPEFFKQVSDAQKFNVIFFPHSDQTPWGLQFLNWILTDPDWIPLYIDEYAMILVKNTPENKSLIQKFGMPQTKLRITKNENTFEANLRIAAFLAKTNRTAESIPYLEEILRIQPTYCPALGVLTETYQAQNNPSAIVYGQRYTTNCL